MTNAQAILTFENSSLREFAFCAAVLVLKMLVTALLISLYRVLRHSYSTFEDMQFWPRISCAILPGLKKPKKHKEGETAEHPDVTRIRSAHRDDMESIPIFLGIGFIYVLCGLPSAKMHFYVFTLARISHTIIYVFARVQPWRMIVYTIGMLSTLSMSVQILYACVSWTPPN